MAKDRPDPAYDPFYLRLQLLGDRRRRLEGLDARVHNRIRQLYRVPGPKGYTSQSLGTASGGRSWGEVGQDVFELRDYLSEWLGLRSVGQPDRVTEEDLHGLVATAADRARRMLARRHVNRQNRMEAHDLVVFYLRWLKRSCDHRKMQDGAQECPDCGVVLVDGERRQQPQ